MKFANLKSALGLVIAQGTGLVLAFALQIVLARLLGLTDFGQYAFFVSCFNIAVLVGKFGLDQLVLRDVRTLRENGYLLQLAALRRISVGWVSMAAALSATVLAAMMSVRASAYDLGLGGVLPAACAVAVLAALTALNAQALISTGRVLLGFCPDAVGRPLLMLMLFGVLWWIEVGVDLAGALLLFAAAVTMVWLFSELAGRKFVWSASPKTHQAGGDTRLSWREVISESFPMLLVAASFLLATQTDILVLGVVSSPEQVATYSVASRLAMLAQLGLVASQSALASQIRKAFSDGNQVALQQHLDTVVYAAMAFAGVAVVVILVSSDVLLGMFGNDFAGAGIPLQILLVYQLINCATGATGVLLNMTGLQRECAKSLAFAVALNFALSVPLAMKFGAIGAAAATVATMSFWNIAMTYYVFRRRAARTWFKLPVG